MSWIPIEMYKYGMIKFGKFKLTSGIESPYYIDVRKLYSYPELARRVVSELIAKIPLDAFEVLAGVESAGIPLAAYISCLTGKPLAYVRKEPKKHGTGNVVEGEVTNRRVAIVDDVVTTGSSLIKAIDNLLNVNAKPVMAVVIVDREQGGKKLLESRGIKLYALLTTTEIFTILFNNGIISRETYDSVLNYIKSFKAD
ncbi:MAG: orotate phosphoribosyltransferase [Desulfurococcaceae archaeon]|nr:orotate phosphoribosyltransferase [Desulfurococcaceae archaeon]